MATPTPSEIVDTLNEYADWSELQSLTRARTWETAAIRFLAIVPGTATDSGSGQTWNAAIVQAELARCRTFIAAQAATARPRQLVTRDWRR